MLTNTITPYTKKILELIAEFEQYSLYKKDFITRVNKLNNDYQRKRLSYFEYSEKLNIILKGKTAKEWLGYYNSQIYSLLKEIEYYNSKIFYIVYSDKSYGQLKVHIPSLTEKGAAFVADSVDKLEEARHATALKLGRLERKEAKKIEEETKHLKHRLKVALNRLERVGIREKGAVNNQIKAIKHAIKIRVNRLERFGEKETHISKLKTRALIRKEKRRVEKELDNLQHFLKLNLRRLRRFGVKESGLVKEEVKDLEHLFKSRLRSLGRFIEKETESAEKPIEGWFKHKIRRAKRFETKEVEKIRENIQSIKHAIKLRIRRLERLEERVIEEPVISTGHWLKLKIRRAKKTIIKPFAALGPIFKRPFKRPELKKVSVPSAQITPAPAVKKHSLFARAKLLFKPKERVPLFEKIIAEEKAPAPAVKLVKKPFLTMVSDLIRAPFMKRLVIGKRTEIGKSLLDLELLREKEIKLAAKKLIRPRILAEEAERVSAILKKKEAITLYKPSTIGAIANATVRKISLIFINKFPLLFEQMYRNLRLANIRILSNTYVNVMFLFSLLSFVLGTVVFTILYASIWSGLLAGLIFLAGIFTSFYYYPINTMRSRIRSIKTNLPFAINHMAAVVNSGVAPVHMFRLIADSKEYGEIVIEIEKIVEFVDLFGYDLTSAIGSVASTTPEKGFKDFLDGMITTIGGGGDIGSYLKEKADASLHTYQLERQKYIETISTYSDIYTGLLIAAPLFFVIALALVSILGGTIMGMPVDMVIALGTYIIIPLLNIVFIVFLELTQPMI